MEENKSQTEIQESKPKRGSGSLLAAARKQQNRSVEEIAEELNLSTSQIRSIELDQTEGLPEPTYVRGYIRSYAKLLGLDPNHVLEHYLNPNWQKGSSLDEMPRGLDHREDSSGRGFSPVMLGVAVVAIALASFLFFTGQLDGMLGTQQESAPVVTEQTADIEPDIDASFVQDQTEVVVNSATDNQDSAAEAVEAAETSASGEHELILTFTDTSWVDVRNEEGERLAYKSYAKGETLQLSSASQMSVFIGNASAVSAAVDGSELDLSPYREGVFARFSVPEQTQ